MKSISIIVSLSLAQRAHSAPPGYGRRLNQIEEFGVSKLSEQELSQFDEECGDYEYELKMHVDQV